MEFYIQQYTLASHWGCVDSKLNKIQEILQTIVLEHLHLLQLILLLKIEGKHGRNDTLGFSLFMVVPTADY